MGGSTPGRRACKQSEGMLSARSSHRPPPILTPGSRHENPFAPKKTVFEWVYGEKLKHGEDCRERRAWHVQPIPTKTWQILVISPYLGRRLTKIRRPRDSPPAQRHVQFPRMAWRGPWSAFLVITPGPADSESHSSNSDLPKGAEQDQTRTCRERTSDE